MIEARLADGTVLRFPPDTPDDVIDRAVRGMAAPKREPTSGETIRDIGANLAGAAGRGVSNLVGLPGDILNLAGRGAAAVAGMLPSHPGVTPEMLAKIGSMYGSEFATPPAMPTGEAVRGVLRDVGVPVDRRAESVGGRIVQDAVEGAASLPAGVANTVYGAVSGVGAGTAGELARALGAGETGETVARVAGGVAAPFAAGRLAAPVRPRPDEVRDGLAATAAAEGIPLTAGQRTGSRPLQVMESVFESLPTTAGAAARQRGEQQDAFNRAVLQRVGVSGNKATPEVLAAAQSEIGGRIGEIAGRNVAVMTPEVQSSWGALLDDVTRNAAPEVRDRVVNRLDDVLKAVGPDGTIPGRAWRELDSAIGSQIQRSEGEVRQYLGKVRDMMTDALEAGAKEGDVAALREARRQYASLVKVENAMGGAGAEAAQGNVAPNLLRQAVAQGDRRGYALGRGDLNELSRVGQTFVRPQIPNSGTQERTMMAQLLTGGAMGGGAGVAAGADPMTTLTLMALGLAGPRVAQAAYNTGPAQRYFTGGAAKALGLRTDREALAAALAGVREAGRAPPQQ
jgi:hypothetical protein